MLSKWAIVYASVGAVAVLALIIALRIRSRRKRRAAFLQLVQLRQLFYGRLEALLTAYDELLAASDADLEVWSRRGLLREFLATLSDVSRNLSELRDRILALPVPSDLISAKGNLLRATNQLDEHVTLLLRAGDTTDVIEIFEDSNVEASLAGARAADVYLQSFSKKYRIDIEVHAAQAS